MENCVIQEITNIDELIELCEKASKSNHRNAKNYDVEQMKKRWNKYLIFTKLMIGKEVIAFSGVYDYGNNLVRVVDRMFIEQKYRYNFMTKSISNPIKPAIQYFIPYQTQWAKKLGYNCFFSIQELKKRNSLIRLAKKLDPTLGYSVLPGLYKTASNSITGWQSIASTTNNISLPNRQI